MQARTLFIHIKELLQVSYTLPCPLVRGKAMQYLPSISNAFLLLEDGKISAFGEMSLCPTPDANMQVIDATGKMIMPTWCDSHTHLVFAGSREHEFVDRIKGLSYQEIAQRGGGILNSAARLQATSEEVLLENALTRINNMKAHGTGAIEIKSGYGLTLESELKILRIIKRLKSQTDIPIKATFLGAHALPLAYKENRQAYIDLLINDMLPVIADEQLADYIDVFCEKVAFSVAEMEQILAAGKHYGLRPKVHVNQFYSLGGIAASMRYDAISVDHLEVVSEEDIAALANGNTIATLLPSAPFFLNDHYPPARTLIDANIPIALATDYNPGSSPSGNMPLAMSLACIKMKMLPEEVIHAATINGAFAMQVEKELGSIGNGKRANIIITKAIPSLAYFFYAFGDNLIDSVWINGKKVHNI